MKKLMSKLLLVIMIFSLTFGNGQVTVKAAENKENVQLEQTNDEKKTEKTGEIDQEVKDKLTKEGMGVDCDLLNSKSSTNTYNTYSNASYDEVTKLNHSNANMIVMLIDFPKSENDPNKGKVTVNSTYTNSQLNTLDDYYCNSKTSLHNYLSTVSDGQCTVNPLLTYKNNNDNKVYVYTAEHPVGYYEVYSESNPIGYKDDGKKLHWSQEEYQRTELFTNAFDNLKKYIPSDLNLDTNNDGEIDAIDFVVPVKAGWSDFLWSHKGSVQDKGHTANGAKLDEYNELAYPADDTTNIEETITHEYLHTVGFPDMYVNEGGEGPLDAWTIMTNIKLEYPTVWERYKYGEWISDNGIKNISNDGEYSLSNSTKDSKTNTIAYKIEIPNSDEFFMIEYRDRNASIMEKDAPNSGIICYRVNPDSKGNLISSPEIYLLRHPNYACSYSYLDGSNDDHKSMDLVTSDGIKIGRIECTGIDNGQAKFKYKKNAECSYPYTTIYYKGYDNPYIHYKIGDGTWTQAPGVKMENSSEVDGYNHSISIYLGNEDKLTACFNNGNGSWDSNNGKNYEFGAGCYTYENGTIRQIDQPSSELKINSITCDKGNTIKQGEIGIFNINVIGGKAPYSYTLKTITNGVLDYYPILLNDDNKTAIYMPYYPGTLTMSAEVKDSEGNTAKLDQDFTVNQVSQNEITIYYKGYDNPYIHYQIDGKAWTNAPGVKMTETSEKPGYTHKVTIDLGDAKKLTACFNNGYGTWDNNYGRNYTFDGVGTYTFSNGCINKIN